MLSAADTASLQVKEYTLSNGLTVWLNEDHSQPKVFGAVVVKAGAKHCPDTGIAHYFEHMMFKGTDKIGTTDYASEKAVLDLIADKYDALAETEDTEARAHLLRIINELSVRASEYVIPNEFDRLISRFGGTKLNAGTSYDYTVYFNTFSPQYIAQWAELNSERLVNPVFRLFQSELETVYEEKNMFSDMVGSMTVEKLTERYFSPHPYAYPIIGSTKNLKNPRLSEMRKFFDTYYVASNMGLILSGDFEMDTILPLLETTFSRIRRGEAPKSEHVQLPPFNGKEKIQVKFPVPFVKVMGFGFRGVPANHPDQAALNIAVAILNNTNGTGYLDKLTVDHKVMTSMAVNESMNEAGMLGVMVMPKLLFQSYGSAEKLAWKQIERLKEGDFSDEVFSSLKLEQLRKYTSGLEDISSRAQVMMRLFSQGKSWSDYMKEVSAINALTKDDVVNIARKYFSNNYLHVTKKTGKYPKEHLTKPDYVPVAPKNKDAVSAYARRLEEMPVKDVPARIVDFRRDAGKVAIHEYAMLYVTPNRVNDIFTLNLIYGIGVQEQPELTQLATYLHLIGTETEPFDQFRHQLQVLGSTLTFEVNNMDFTIKVTGFDAHFNETLALVGDFMRHAKADDKKLRQIVDDAKVAEKAFFKSSEYIAEALLEKVRFGNRSRFLTKLSLPEIKKLKGKTLLESFARLQQKECSLHYCGKLTATQIEGQLRKALPLENCTQPSASPLYNDRQAYDKPLIYFVDMPDLSQSIVYSYVLGEAPGDAADRYASKLFAGYFGGDMSSLMFQEIREFRSFAYRVNARYSEPPLNHPDKQGDFIAMLSTQCDKTVDALTVLDSLIREMPLRPERVDDLKQNIRNQINNEYPGFRQISSKIAAFSREGYTDDPNEGYLNGIRTMGMDDIVRFYEKNVQGRPVVYSIVGNSKHIDMTTLASFGTIVKLAKKDIYK